MKKIITAPHLLLFFVLCLFHLNSSKAQLSLTVQSTCLGNDSLKNAFKKDASRLAVRRVYSTNSNFKDSILPEKPLRDGYLKALVAIFHATGLKVRDTIIKIYKIHTHAVPELSSISVKASGTYNWMQNLANSTVPVNNVFLDYLITKYSLYPGPYYQSGTYDVAVLRTDSNLNMGGMAKAIKAIPGVVDATPDETLNFIIKDITDSIKPNYTELTFSYGWGTCENGCDYRIYWHFKVYNNCIVEYNGYTGDKIDTGLNENFLLLDNLQAYPNPVNDKLQVNFGFADTRKINLNLYNHLGQSIAVIKQPHSTEEIDMTRLPLGVYYLSVEAGTYKKVVKIIK